MADPHLVLTSQLRPPALRPDILPRRRLLSALRAAATHRLVLLSADAGYGKTTLLAQFHAGCPGTAVWYSLTERDADLEIFLHLLCEAVGARFRTARHPLHRFLAEHPAPHADAAGAAGAFVDILSRCARRDCYLIVDDAHLLRGSPFVPRFLAAFVDLAPPHLHLVLGARNEPPLPVPLWRARGHVFELRNTDLRFRRDEVDELCRGRLGLDMKTADTDLVFRRTDGWVAGVRWTAERVRLSGGLSSVQETLEELGRSPGGLAEFYEAELFRCLPEREQRFLLRIASLETVTDELAELAWKAHDGLQLLCSLVRRNLLTAGAGRGGREFRLHPLFREFLEERAREELSPTERARLLEELGERLLRGDPAQGLEQWRRIPDPARVARWLAENGAWFLSHGRYSQLGGLLDTLPRGAFDADPRLLFLRGENRRILGDFAGARSDFGAVTRRAASTGDASLAAEAALGSARVCNAAGDAARALRTGRGLLGARARLRPGVRARALQLVGGALFYLGRYRETERALCELRALLTDHPDPELEPAAEHNLALTYCAMGRFLEARALFENCLKRPEVRHSRRRALHLANLALLRLELGEMDRARESVVEGESLVADGGSPLQQATVMLARAEVERRSGNLATATSLATDLAGRGGDLAHQSVGVGLLLLRAQVALARGEAERARELSGEGLRALRGGRGSLWFDLKLLEARAWLSEGRATRAATLLRALLREAVAGGLRHIQAAAGLALAEALWRAGEADGAVRAAARALAICGRERYEQITAEAAEQAPELHAECWARGGAEWLSPLFARHPERFWPVLDSRFQGRRRPRPDAAASLADWGDERCLGLLRRWAAEGGPTARDALRAQRALEKRLGLSPSRRGGTALEVRLLGPLEVRVLGERLPLRAFRTERAAELMAYLALRGPAGETRERLQNMLWPQASTAEARRSLSLTLSYVREAVRGAVPGAEVVERDRDRVRLSAALELRTDLDLVRRFELPEGARSASGTGRPGAAVELVTAWRGEFLEGWDSAWVVAERERLARIHRRALLELAAEERGAQRPEEAERWLRDALELDPADEAAHRELLEILAQRGEFTRLWAEHRSFLDLLRSEFNLVPEPSTLRLVARLRARQKESVN
ncbi:MAG: hypothetical protein HZB25_11780 [Candidatus Eisenbacteria bacterium]|nr:hypothetical protein [Candidatus Eisenbacteria bacterium]